jgi:hypothetical protein
MKQYPQFLLGEVSSDGGSGPSLHAEGTATTQRPSLTRRRGQTKQLIHPGTRVR